MATYTFDPYNKWIIIPNAETDTDMADIYNDCMDWVDSDVGMSYGIPLSAFGKKELSPGIYSDIIYQLNDGWKLRYYVGTYQANITGTVITDDQSVKTSLPAGSNIEIVFKVATQATVLSSATDIEATADQVWDEAASAHETADSIGEKIKEMHEFSELAFILSLT